VITGTGFHWNSKPTPHHHHNHTPPLISSSRQAGRQARTPGGAVRRRTGPRSSPEPQNRPHPGSLQEGAEIHQAAAVVPPAAAIYPGPALQVLNAPHLQATSGAAQISISLPPSYLRRRRSTRAQLSRSSALPTCRQLPERRRYPSACRQPAAGGCARYLPGTCQVHH